ncbi:MAG TPA: hypothetical protein VM260_13685, partial [Pirellula sp.]|nr:hypothetical protein [Pirellula sp.]
DQALLIAKESGRDRVIGLGLDTKTSNLMDTKKKSNSSNARSWLGWFQPTIVFKQEYQLITNVPRDVTLQKLKGFVSGFHAAVVEVEGDRIVLQIDCRKAPIPQIKNERLGKFHLEIGIAEVNAGDKKGNVKTCTLLNLQISPVRSRDRRTDALVSQATRLKTAFQGMMVAHDMDEESEGDLLRRINPKKETRC